MSDKSSGNRDSNRQPGLSLLGGIIGAVWGAIVGARAARTEPIHEITARRVAEPEIVIPPLPPYSRQQHFPPRPAPDWSNPKPAALPKPTYAPASVAFGIMLSAAGVVTSFWVSFAGVIVFALGIAGWIGDLFHEHND